MTRKHPRRASRSRRSSIMLHLHSCRPLTPHPLAVRFVLLPRVFAPFIFTTALWHPRCPQDQAKNDLFCVAQTFAEEDRKVGVLWPCL